MVRIPLSPAQREAGRLLGDLLRESRGAASMVDVAGRAGVPVDTLRKIETGRVPTPSFAVVSAIARVLGLSLDEIAAAVESAATVEDTLPARTA